VIANHAQVIVNLALAFDIYASRIVKLALIIVTIALAIVNYAQAIATQVEGNCL
jgi:hypothetical protein